MKLHNNNDTAIAFLGLTALLVLGGVIAAGYNIFENHRIAEQIKNRVDSVIPVEVNLNVKMK